jgi:hypothetical protein
MKRSSLTRFFAVLMLLGMTLFILEDAFARGGRGGGGRSGGMGRSSRGSRGSNRDKDVKRDRERDQRENRDAFKRAAADDAE